VAFRSEDFRSETDLTCFNLQNQSVYGAGAKVAYSGQLGPQNQVPL
jgi:hypothetical protein